MDAIVQLIRNALCVVKDLKLFPTTFIHDASHTTKYYSINHPDLSQTTPLEVVISITQLYACLSCIKSGLKLIFPSGIFNLQKLNRVLASINNYYADPKNKTKDNDNSAVITKQVLVYNLVKQADTSTRNTFEGICVLVIGISFFWLFANSWHVTSAGWIGGLPALIHALTAMEIVLVPLLCYMVKDGLNKLKEKKELNALSDKIDKRQKSSNKKDSDNVFMLWEMNHLMVVTNDLWKPFWSTNNSVTSETRMVDKEVEKVHALMMDFDNKVLKNDSSSLLEKEAERAKWEGYRSFVYFILNFIAFYGYMLGILVYYFEDEEKQPSYVKSLRLGYSNSDADWSGNFAGDFMWTVEPMIILSSPLIIKAMLNRQKKKTKSD